MKPKYTISFSFRCSFSF
uniref:Uncharacterized protein n=1 Tax=Arundo donax TaxID=35708 RepID=A0A0A9BTI5_ARUDO